MFITVYYGDNKQAIFNPNCLNHVLLEAIKTKCHCDNQALLDLSDQTGMVKNLLNNPMDYGTGYVSERENVVLLQVQREVESEEGRLTYTPLLTDKLHDPDFIARLNPKPVGSHLRHSKQQTRRLSGVDSPEEKAFSRHSGRRNSSSRRGSIAGSKRLHKLVASAPGGKNK